MHIQSEFCELSRIFQETILTLLRVGWVSLPAYRVEDTINNNRLNVADAPLAGRDARPTHMEKIYAANPHEESRNE